jgi:hypothetical protein
MHPQRSRFSRSISFEQSLVQPLASQVGEVDYALMASPRPQPARGHECQRGQPETRLIATSRGMDVQAHLQLHPPPGALSQATTALV